MRKIVITSLAALLVSSALPVSAASPAAATSNALGAPSAQQQRVRTDQAEERQICVREALTTSRVPRRVCHTAREWRDLHGSDSDAR